jgi:hypothetical protein
MTDATANRITDDERCAGMRADFHIYYRRAQKVFVTAMWAQDAQEAEKQFAAISRELRWRTEIVRIVALKHDA